MRKNKIQKKYIITFCILFTAIILFIHSIGSFNNGLINDKSNKYNDSSASESNKNNLNENHIIDDVDNDADESSYVEICNFIDKTRQRYPVLSKIGKNMGINKKGIINIIEILGCEKTVETYISIFSRLFNI